MRSLSRTFARPYLDPTRDRRRSAETAHSDMVDPEGFLRFSYTFFICFSGDRLMLTGWPGAQSVSNSTVECYSESAGFSVWRRLFAPC